MTESNRLTPTPGPWYVEDMRDFKRENPQWGQPAYEHGGYMVFSPDCDSHPVADCSGNHTCRDEEECEANAHLISAAHELLAVVMGIVTDCKDSINPGLYELAVEAIAKAEGRTREAAKS